MKYSITIIEINFSPEDTAIGLYSTQMCEYLSKKCYDLNVIIGFPYYPKWEISQEYKNRIIHLLQLTFESFRNLFKIKEYGIKV